jgi:hypothetical protein
MEDTMKKFITIITIVTLLMMTVSNVMVVSAQEPTSEPTEEPTVEPTEEPTPEPTEEPTVEPTEEPTTEPTEEPTVEPTEEPTTEPTEEPTVEPTEEPTTEPTEEPTVEPTEEPTVGPAAALPGSFTTQIIAIANLETSGSPEAPALTLYDIDGTGTNTVSGIPVAYPGGVVFVRDSQLSDGRYAGVIQSSFQAAAAALTVNSTARTADAYMGFNAPATELFATLIFNKHSNWESTLICQNAGSSAANINAYLYKTGDTSPRVSLTATSVGANESVVWDIADDSTVQSQWPGGSGQYGFARFTSTNNIACIVDNQRMASPYVQSQYNAVPASYAGTELYSPLVFNGHGSSSTNQRGLKWNSGVSIVNTTSNAAYVTVTYTANTGYVATCTKTIAGNGSANWYTPEVASLGWSCTPNASLPWSYPGPTYGSIKLTSTQPVLALTNSNRYDSGEGLGAGYSNACSSPSVATNRLVCPLAFNKNAATDWVTGIRVANVGTVTTNVTWKMVRVNSDPSGSGKSVSITKTGIVPGAGESAYFPEESTALTNFEGVVFVEASNSSAKIAATSSNTNYNTLGAGAMYDCYNY